MPVPSLAVQAADPWWLPTVADEAQTDRDYWEQVSDVEDDEPDLAA